VAQQWHKVKVKFSFQLKYRFRLRMREAIKSQVLTPPPTPTRILKTMTSVRVYVENLFVWLHHCFLGLPAGATANLISVDLSLRPPLWCVTFDKRISGVSNKQLSENTSTTRGCVSGERLSMR
jgi:hypothetical protein